MGAKRIFTREWSPTLAAQIFDFYMDFFNVPNDTLPFHGGSRAAIPRTLYLQIPRSFHAMHAHVF